MLARILILALCLAPVLAGAQGFVVDHTCTDLSQVPPSYLDLARSNLRVGYGHTSHGSQLVTGLDAWRDTDQPQYDFASSGWGLVPGVFLNDYWGNAGGASDLGHNGDLAWRNATITMLNQLGNDRNVVIWSWCGGVSDNTSAGIQAYLDAMAGLETAYPSVRFIYMTGHLDGSGTAGNLNQRNNQIRAWCAAHHKVLFDFADIESYHPGGTIDYRALYATDGCEYDTNGDGNPWGDGNWAQEWVAAHPAAELTAVAAGCSECAHSERLNCVLKGSAFWWLLARLLGWDPAAAGRPAEVASGDTPDTAQGWADKNTHQWPASAAATSYRLYRGLAADLPNLLSSQTDSCLTYSGSATSATAEADPSSEAGRLHWFLVTGVNGYGEGTAGQATSGTRIVNAGGGCPPPLVVTHP
jgi:hypothetical protein